MNPIQTGQVQQVNVDHLYQFTANLLINEKRSDIEVKEILIAQGIDNESASNIVENVETQIQTAKKEKANKDMLYGALWCAGGTIATIADTGFIFWGAIVFGGIQFIRGAIGAYGNN